MDYGIHDVPMPHTAFKTTGWVMEHEAPTDKLPLMGGIYSGGLWNVLRKAAGFAHMRGIGCYFFALGHSVGCRSPPFLTF